MFFSISTLQLVSLSLLFIFFFFLHQINKSKPKANSPPGPPPLPIIGNLHQLSPLAHRSLAHLSQIHGPLLHLSLGCIPTLVISSSSLARQLFTTLDHCFLDRPPLLPLKHYSFNSSDIASSPYNASWRNLRKVFATELVNPAKLLSSRHTREEETEKMIGLIKTHVDMKLAINISECSMNLINEIICKIAFGKGVDGEERRRRRWFREMVEEVPAIMGSFFVGDYFPGMGWVDVVVGKVRKLKKSGRELDKFYEEVIDEHLGKFGDGKREKGGVEEDVVDALIRLWREGEISMDNIKGVLMNIFIAGVETPASTIIWAMTELARNPPIMKKAQDEVRKIIGKKGKVEESDLPQLHYLKCVVNETLRLHPPAPLLVPRESMRHCQIDGYDIQPKTRVLVNVWAIGRDKEVWENAEEFIPDRFIESPIDYKGHDFRWLPFGGGRRICPGIDLGILCTQLPLANLLYAFNWELPPGMKEEDIDMFETPGMAACKKIDLCLQPISVH